MGRRADLLARDTPESVDRARRVLLECSDVLDDGFHVTLVEDLRDIAAALPGDASAASVSRMTDHDLRRAYIESDAEAGDLEQDALADEIERRGLDV